MGWSLVGLMLVAQAPAASAVRIEAPPVVAGFAPVTRINGLTPHEVVRVHLFRVFTRWVTDDPTQRTGWHEVPQPLHAWVAVRADARGQVDLSRAQPDEGTYRGVDAYGLMWSGRKPGDASLSDAAVAGFDPATLPVGAARLVVTRGHTEVAQASVASSTPAGITTTFVADGTLNGSYAAPADGRRHPALILLHGSEGGDRDGATALAQRFAGQGFAAFSLNWFAWDLKGLSGVPNVHANQPIELLTRVRDWLATRPEADVARVGVYGHSKGAEYATVAAVYLPWIRAVAACVPSDAVWEGYGFGDARNRATGPAPARLSSWSWQGQPLPYITLPPRDDRSTYFNNTAYYEARRAADPVAAAAARIPVARSDAHFLWLGGGRDATWASGAMAARNDAALRRAGKGAHSELHLYPSAGHAICGDGTYPTRLWSDASADPRRPDPDAEGVATVDGWRRMIAFFRRILR